MKLPNHSIFQAGTRQLRREAGFPGWNLTLRPAARSPWELPASSLPRTSGVVGRWKSAASRAFSA